VDASAGSEFIAVRSSSISPVASIRPVDDVRSKDHIVRAETAIREPRIDGTACLVDHTVDAALPEGSARAARFDLVQQRNRYANQPVDAIRLSLALPRPTRTRA
jgi:hypothetical protein